MLRKFWIEVRSSLWFVPGLLVLVGIGLALGLIQLDLTFADTLKGKTWQPLLNTGAEGARGMLTAIAGSMITVAGVAFSITIVTLSLASSQYTPRILRNFMRDRANQVLLGTFVGIFAYCIVVLRTIRGGAERDGGGFVPLLAVAFTVLLALVAIGGLIFFIHHVAASIQASSILQEITRETHDAIEELFPEQFGEADEDPPGEGTLRDRDWWPVGAEETGYLQHVDPEGLLRFAERHDATLRLERTPGDFVSPGTPLALADRELDEAARGELRALFVVGDFRTLDQDASFGVRQIVDIALKALSPGINDTSTAVSCLDYLGAILGQLAGRRMVSPFRAGDEGKLRVLAPAPDFGWFVAESLDEIRLCAGGNVTILRQMLRMLGRVAARTRDPARREALATHARLVAEMADHTVPAAYDRARLNGEIARVRGALEVGASALPALSVESAGVADDSPPHGPANLNGTDDEALPALPSPDRRRPS